MLATPGEIPADDAGWAYEMKWDGVRALVAVDGDRIEIVSRLGNDITRRYPELAGIATALAPTAAVLDGEIVAFDDAGAPSFGLLQRRMGLTNEARIRQRVVEAPVTYIAFDLLWLDGVWMLDARYSDRRELLAGLGFDGPSWQTPKHRLGDGEALIGAVRERGLEGIVAKRLESPYRPGRRSPDWVKVQNRRRQELVIGGWMPGEGARHRRVGSLLVGYWDSTAEEAERLGREQRLVYAGGVGSGFTDTALDELTSLLAPLARRNSPFEAGWDPEVKYAARARERGGLRWCEPVTVCEVEFTQWTHEGTVRAATFKGLRDDTDPREVVRETG